MKMKNFIVLLALALCGALSANAQNRMNVHLTNGEVTTFSISDVDFVDWDEKTTPEGDGTEPKFENIKINGMAYHLGISGAIDLGLSVKWAAYNVGAEAPEEYGDYYAWGETKTKSKYDWSTYLDSPNRDGKSFTKYATDKKTVLDPEDDVAHVKWGGSWRIPTKAEQDELRTKCFWTWTTQNGVNGRMVTGPNGNSIFLPAAGSRYNNSLDHTGNFGYDWSSSLYEDYSDDAYGLNFGSGYVDWYNNYRFLGLSVRPVCP